MNLFDTLPNFMILGAAKAGTTSLFELLKQHPAVFMPFSKEPMFFSNDEYFERGLEWYARTYFKRASGYPARGEATPHYLYWSEKVARRIRETYRQQSIKFIVIFRDPVARAYSWYWNMVKEGREDLSFTAALEQEAGRLQEHGNQLRRSGSMTYGYVFGSCYATLLQPFLSLFPKQDFHFLLQEDLNENYSTALRALQATLGIEAGYAGKPVTSNQATQPRSRRVQAVLRGESPAKEIVKKLLPLRLRHAIMNILLPANARAVKYPAMDSDIEAELRGRFAPEVHRLEKIIDRDLSLWLPR